MTRFGIIVLLFFGLCMFVIGGFSGSLVSFSLVKTNKLEGYHCQPITTHSTLEDAKAQVERYQERVK